MTTSDITFPVTLPSEFAIWFGTPSQASEVARELIILELYQESRISGGKAAELLGLTRRGFVSLLARKGIPYFRYDEQEWAREVEAVRQWQAEQPKP